MVDAPILATSDEQITAGTKTLGTRFGELRFELGCPTDETAAALFDAMDFQRATEMYLWALPFVSFGNWRLQQDTALGTANGDVANYHTFAAHINVLTASGTIPYTLGFVDLREGPVVLDAPRGTAIGFFDLWQRPIHLPEAGIRDPSARVSYLLLGPGHEVDDTAGFTVLRCRTFTVRYSLQSLPRDSADAVRMLAGCALQSYADARAGKTPHPPRFVDVDTYWPAYQPRGLEYWRVLNDLLNVEHRETRDAYAASLLASLGIGVGRPFAPDAQLAAILSEATLVGEAMARALDYNPRHDRGRYEETQWRQVLDFEPDEQMDGQRIQSDERAAWFYEAVTAAKSMASTEPGPGAVYLAGRRDADGDWLDGGRQYHLHVPAGVPAARFWSATAYSTDTRCLVDTPHQKADCSSLHSDTVFNDDGSVDIWFGPDQPQVAPYPNWIPTPPGEGFFVYFRVNQPEAAYFDRTWKLPDIHKVASGDPRSERSLEFPSAERTRSNS